MLTALNFVRDRAFKTCSDHKRNHYGSPRGPFPRTEHNRVNTLISAIKHVIFH